MLAAESLPSGWFLEHAWLIPLVPAIAFAVIILFGKRIGKPTDHGAYIGIAAMATSLVLSIGAAIQWIDRSHAAGEEAFVAPVVKKWVWWQSGNFEFAIGQHVDGLAIVMLLLVAFISTLVQIYSLEYVRGDRRYTHFFASITLFSAGMLVMVLAENMVQLILGWEIMGLCSFLLIGHWWEDEDNSRAALKAFFTVRVGDVGLLVGTAIIFGAAGTMSISGINAWALSGEPTKTVLLWAAVAMFIACIGKSGQFPLHTWLPDAMAGPTPVSSLLHSSTMVVAGVFLVARLYPVFFEGLKITDTNVNLIAVIGGITIVIAAGLAFVQHDIKKVLAYSTVSQLGYMMMGLGVGAWLPAVFHIFTHAFFKCCLFLCAGSVSHSASHHSFDMKKDMGGLRKAMPWTFGAWMLSTAALMGIPLFSGFFSKDEIIDSAEHNGYQVFWIVGLVGAAMTAAYMTRATYLTFFGEARGAAAGDHHDEEHGAHTLTMGDARISFDTAPDHDDPALVAPGAGAGHGGHGGGHDADGHDDHHSAPHESPWLIRAPIAILAVLAVVSGYLNAPAFHTEYFTEWVEARGEPVGEEEAAVVLGSGPGEALVVAPAADEPAAEGEGGHSEEAAKEGCGFEEPAPGTTCFAINHHVLHPKFTWAKAAPSILLVAAGVALSGVVCVALYGRKKAAVVGLTRRNKVANAGYQFLANKYYLDDLYEKVVVHGVAHPIAQAAYWTNQKVLDGIVNAVGIGTRMVGRWVYRNIDQRVVDTAVNASGIVASETGHALQPVQSGRVNQYGALLFAAAAVGAIVLVIVNT
jgi:NADH-quinone oxidoreductase subunit L